MFAGELLRVVTWLGEPRGARVDRQYLVFRELRQPTEVVVAGRPVTSSSMPADRRARGPSHDRVGLRQQSGSARAGSQRGRQVIPSRRSLTRLT